jgi:hypothetical protein
VIGFIIWLSSIIFYEERVKFIFEDEAANLCSMSLLKGYLLNPIHSSNLISSSNFYPLLFGCVLLHFIFYNFFCIYCVPLQVIVIPKLVLLVILVNEIDLFGSELILFLNYSLTKSSLFSTNAFLNTTLFLDIHCLTTSSNL